MSEKAVTIIPQAAPTSVPRLGFDPEDPEKVYIVIGGDTPILSFAFASELFLKFADYVRDNMPKELEADGPATEEPGGEDGEEK